MTLPGASLANQVRQHIATTLHPILPGGCTKDTRRCPDARDYNADLRECCKGHIRQIVADVAEVFQRLNIVWWLDYGSLLGAVRNPMLGLKPGIIPHDKDGDFGMLHVPFYTLGRARSLLQRKGYNVVLRPGGRSMKVRLSQTNHTNADFFNWHEDKQGRMYRVRYIGADKYKGRAFEKAQAFPLTTMEWEGMQLPAPRNAAAFCLFRYGPDWMTPVHANNDGVRRGSDR